MNAVIAAVGIMLVLSLSRVHVVIALIVGAVVGGLVGGLSIEATLEAFNSGLGGGATVALSYALLGAFAVAIAKSGLAHALADRALAMVNKQQAVGGNRVKWLLIGLLLVVAICSQNILPIHIAFIPLLVPPLLYVLTKLKIDRRLVACVMTFGLITPYMFLPVGFGNIFLNQILLANVSKSGVDISQVNVTHAMAIPALGMLVGLLVAVFISYRKKREYDLAKIEQVEQTAINYNPLTLLVAGVAIASAFIIQLWLGSMIIGALVGFLIFSVSGIVRWRETDDLFTEGMKMMAMIGFIMIAASGFAEVMKATGEVKSLVEASAGWINHSQGVGALLMLLVGLLVTMGIGSSFSTVPILAAIFVPLCVQLGFSPMAIVCIVGTAGALGDAGSPASDSTLGPTSGLNIDGQHHHIWDTVVPTFLHYNLPLLAFGWAAAMIL
ncbi:TRAP transporter large permease subunit [Pseudomonas sp. FSL R10-1350]|jgi:predicted histidine transporter YuiF (NhaC family)|uniref:TRAP transporter large permease subunit n=1 Tax=Pseudomonas helleri TaxID=1608996 RepID=A0A0J6I0P1_9PSED|nr:MULTISPECIES: Na+/H+ antiporter NhaC family protein [Pseudomonas]KMN08240.1 sodium:proton antiporter [Pseudomonas helleri]KMN24313.1 sodium:proton antiporter [Pseudomonas helleri]MCU1753605.1 TRAP transporter large permease subunit [Pseudomonas helleri]MQT34718.1 TRAP transporter large permease subunit [Pseudomonas helleri]MQT40683.1 TRAP transporter large permease subunit [Pseudomonas sp. FSL R10-0765]